MLFTCTHYVSCMYMYMYVHHTCTCIYTLYCLTVECIYMYPLCIMYVHVHTILNVCHVHVFTCTHYTFKCIYMYTLYC